MEVGVRVGSGVPNEVGITVGEADGVTDEEVGLGAWEKLVAGMYQAVCVPPELTVIVVSLKRE